MIEAVCQGITTVCILVTVVYLMSLLPEFFPGYLYNRATGSVSIDQCDEQIYIETE